jgi:hypothetical protein
MGLQSPVFTSKQLKNAAFPIWVTLGENRSCALTQIASGR